VRFESSWRLRSLSASQIRPPIRVSVKDRVSLLLEIYKISTSSASFNAASLSSSMAFFLFKDWNGLVRVSFVTVWTSLRTSNEGSG